MGVFKRHQTSCTF